MVKGEWIKPGAVVIDCGINAIPGRIIRNHIRMIEIDVFFIQMLRRSLDLV